MAANVDSSLTMYEAKSTYTPNPAAAGGGIIEIRVRLRYQLRIKARGIDKLVDEILTPEFVSPFAMPLNFLLPELSVKQVSYMLAAINVDAKVRASVSPTIAKFGVEVAKRHRDNPSGFMAVAQLSLTKTDYIREEEFDRIAKMMVKEKLS